MLQGNCIISPLSLPQFLYLYLSPLFNFLSLLSTLSLFLSLHALSFFSHAHIHTNTLTVYLYLSPFLPYLSLSHPLSLFLYLSLSLSLSLTLSRSLSPAQCVLRSSSLPNNSYAFTYRNISSQAQARRRVVQRVRCPADPTPHGPSTLTAPGG